MAHRRRGRIGDAARNQIERNYANTVYAVKRLMGRRFGEEIVQKDKAILSYEVVADSHGRAGVQVNYKGEQKIFKPEEISAMILTKMKEIAEAYLNQKVVNAVVTVPAYFNDAQRQATKDAGTISGLNVVRILNEPTAAAIAYGLDKGEGEKKVLVFDLGGGTFDVSLLTIDQGFFEVKATNGDTHLGGEDFDNRIIEHFIKVIKKKHNVDISKNQYTLARLRKVSENAKRKLSSLPEAQVEIDNLVDGVDFSDKLTRAKFEELCADLFKGTLEPVKLVLADAQMDKDTIDEVVLVGGSTRIPKIQSLIKEFFNGKQPNKGINPDEAIAYGAAVQAGVLSGATSLTGKVLLIDVIPLSLGIETIGGVMLPIIPRNSIIPASKKQTVTTTSDNQVNILFQVFEGERAMTKDNRNLGQFDLAGLKKAPRGVAQVEVQMDVDVDGILHVKASDLAGGSSESIFITNDKMRLSQEEIDRMVQDAKTYEEEDKKLREQSTARVQLEQYAYQAKGQAATGGEYEKYLTENEREKVTTAVTNAINWLDERETKDGATKDQYEEKMTALKAEIDELLEKAKKEKKETEDKAPPQEESAGDGEKKEEPSPSSAEDEDHDDF